MKRMVKRMAAAVCGLLLAGAWDVRGDVHSDARFSGGSRDGYDVEALNQSGTDWAAFAALMLARSRGGSYDGYAVGAQLGAKLPPRGTIFMIR